MAGTVSEGLIGQKAVRLTIAAVARGLPLNTLIEQGLSQWQITEALTAAIKAEYVVREGRDFIASAAGRTALARFRAREPLQPLDHKRLDYKTRVSSYILERRAIEEIRKRVSA